MPTRVSGIMPWYRCRSDPHSPHVSPARSHRSGARSPDVLLLDADPVGTAVDHRAHVSSSDLSLVRPPSRGLRGSSGSGVASATRYPARDGPRACHVRKRRLPRRLGAGPHGPRSVTTLIATASTPVPGVLTWAMSGRLARLTRRRRGGQTSARVARGRGH